MTTINPLSDRVLLKRHEAEKKTASGLYIPDVAQKKSTRCEVVAVGPGRVLEDGRRREVSLKRGDVVLIGEWTGTEITIDGVEHLMVREDEVHGVIDGE